MGSLYLCADPGPWSGVARILDFGNTFDVYNGSATGEQADNIGILWDWAVVGNDLWNAVYVNEAQLKTPRPQHEAELVAR